MENEMVMYVEDPECVDDQQGYWFRGADKPGPEAEEEFDGILNIKEAGFYIRDFDTACRAVELHGWKWEIRSVIWR